MDVPYLLDHLPIVEHLVCFHIYKYASITLLVPKSLFEILWSLRIVSWPIGPQIFTDQLLCARQISFCFSDLLVLLEMLDYVALGIVHLTSWACLPPVLASVVPLRPEHEGAPVLFGLLSISGFSLWLSSLATQPLRDYRLSPHIQAFCVLPFFQGILRSLLLNNN